MSQLKPCPICHSNFVNYVNFGNDDNPVYKIKCHECGFITHIHSVSKERITKYWNNRED